MNRLESGIARRGCSLLMGIVNVTGDSFSEQEASSPATALDRALKLLDDGADLLDIGGESTRPESLEIPVEEELARIIPVIRELRRLRPEVILSVDTRKSEVARAVIDLGVDLINDVSMLRHSPDMARVVAASEAGLIIAHSRGTPQNMREERFHDYGDDAVETVISELAAAKAQALEAGVPDERIFVDPDFGFAKTPEQDWELMKRIDELHRLGPIVAGMSRKSFLGRFLNQPDPMQRLGGTVAAAVFLAARRVEILRVHDIRQIRDALQVAMKLNLVQEENEPTDA